MSIFIAWFTGCGFSPTTAAPLPAPTPAPAVSPVASPAPAELPPQRPARDPSKRKAKGGGAPPVSPAPEPAAPASTAPPVPFDGMEGLENWHDATAQSIDVDGSTVAAVSALLVQQGWSCAAEPERFPKDWMVCTNKAYLAERPTSVPGKYGYVLFVEPREGGVHMWFGE